MDDAAYISWLESKIKANTEKRDKASAAYEQWHKRNSDVGKLGARVALEDWRGFEGRRQGYEDALIQFRLMQIGTKKED